MLGMLLPGIIACSDDNSKDNPSTSSTANENSNSWYGNATAMRLEMPALKKDRTGMYFITHEANINNTSTTKTVNYSIEFDSTACHSRWVAFAFDDTTKQRHTSRSDAWASDPLLPEACRLTGYFPNPYNRGHLCASADRLFSTEGNQQTFYLSNMSPQLGNFNGGYWVVLESLIQSWGRFGSFKKLYVCKGGTIEDTQVKAAISCTNTKGSKVTVKVPKYYFMAILAETSKPSYQAIGFLMEHKDYGYTSNNKPDTQDMKQHAMSIDKLEEMTGIDFFCNLNDAVENTVEKSYSENAWTW